MKAGDRVLIHSAGGPVGTALLQLGALSGLEMYGTASQRKHDLVSSFGAVPIDYKAVDFVDEIRRLIPDGKKVVPYSIRTLKRRHPDWYREDMTFLFDLLSQRKLTPIVAKRLGLEKAADAHGLLSDGSVTGRIMLVTG